MAILNNNWFNLNSTRRYPIDDSATGESDEGFDLPNDILVDIRLRFPRSLGRYASISSISCSSGIVSVTIIGHEYHPMVNNVSAAAESFSPLAVVSIPKPISPNVPYQVRALSDGVFGWIVFGEGVEKNFAARFSNADQALLSPKLAFSYGSGTVTSISIVNTDTKLYGDVVLRGVGDLKIKREVRTYQGIGTVNGLVFTLENASTNDNLFEKYKGKCQGRPESDSCKKTSVEYINDIYPDCYGNIDISFSQNGIKQERLINTIYEGYALELPLGLAEACTTDDYLPDPNGNLPNEYGDVCADIAASEGDPDAIAYTNNLIDANPYLSSAVITSSLPHLDTMVLSPGSTTKPTNFEFINSNFAYEETVYYRGFPEFLTTVGLAVKSSGSRFVGVWNDNSTNDHTYQSDVSTTKNGCRVSVTFAFKQLSSLGSAGVIIDYTTVYISSCDKYAKTYLLATLDFSTKRLKLLNWTGFTWITVAQSPTIPNLSTGEWYSLDVQKDTSDTSGTKVKYDLRLYTAESYWTDLTVSSSSLFTEVGSTPKSGYSVPLADNLITSLSAYAEPNNGLAGIGTVTGGPLFSYFFVG